MTTPDSDAPPRRIKRRRVRVKDHQRNRVAYMSLLVVGLSGVFLFLIWVQLAGREPEPAVQRAPEEVLVEWMCPKGHVFHEPWRRAPRFCPACGGTSYPVHTYVCTRHGAFDVWVRPDSNWTPQQHSFDYKLGDGPWLADEDGLRCPRCTRPLIRARKDPFGRIIHPPMDD